MNDVPILHYQCNNGFPIWDFCYSAVFGAEQNGVKHKPFDVWTDKIDGNPYNIIVGSVEECSKWLKTNGYEVPQEIDITPSIKRTRYTKEEFLQLTEYPCFIKPYGEIKAFTGTVVKDRLDAELVLNYYSGDIWVYKHIMPFISEWRVYIHNGKVLKVCNYRGSPLEFPDQTTMGHFINQTIRSIKYKAFTIDFGVGIAPNGSLHTYLIEGNDMWAIANYGLEPNDYYQAVKDRWYQITGLIK